MMHRAHFLAGIALLALAGCVSLQPRPALPPEAAVPIGEGTPLDTVIAAAEARHPGESGFRLVNEGPEAFAIRSRSALSAGRSLDVQTYIWNDDGTGAFLAYRLLQAADRGVKVRLLVDDMDARGNNYAFAALDAHPNIEVRMFNPFESRSGSVSFALEAIGSFSRINHRMHNKTWIADNRIAIVGGRNLGDEYFGASEEVNFSDLDFAMVGPIVRDASASFDRYWNSPLAYPIALLSPKGVTTEALDALRKEGMPRIEDRGAIEVRTGTEAERRGAAPGVGRLADAMERPLPLHFGRSRQGRRQGPGPGRIRRARVTGTGRFADEREADRDLAVLRAGRKGHGGIRESREEGRRASAS